MASIGRCPTVVESYRMIKFFFLASSKIKARIQTKFSYKANYSDGRFNTGLL